MDYKDAGAARTILRAWRGPFFWIVVAACFGPETFLIFSRLTNLRWLDLIAGVGVLLGCFLILIWRRERYRVCQHGLIVGFKKKSEYVIPWASIDPGRVRVVKRIGLLRRLPGMRWRSPHYRASLVSLGGIVLNGFAKEVPVPSWKITEPNPVSTPFGWWLLATRRPDALLRAMEEAMVADGYPAEGLAARARAQAFTVTWKPTPESPISPRLGTDPVIGVDGPLMTGGAA